MCMYIYRERERERDVAVTYIYIYIYYYYYSSYSYSYSYYYYLYIYIYIYGSGVCIYACIMLYLRRSCVNLGVRASASWLCTLRLGRTPPFKQNCTSRRV